VLRLGSHRSVKELEREFAAWNAKWNEDPRHYVWVKTADEILSSLARLCKRISEVERWLVA
jgi:broad specificity phosphatase PhoE